MTSTAICHHAITMMIVCARQYSESESESVSSYACPIFNAGGGFGCGIPGVKSLPGSALNILIA